MTICPVFLIYRPNCQSNNQKIVFPIVIAESLLRGKDSVAGQLRAKAVHNRERNI